MILKKHRLAILPDSTVNGELLLPEFKFLESNFTLKAKHRKYKNKIMGGDINKGTPMTQFLSDVLQPQVNSIIKRNDSITKSESIKVTNESLWKAKKEKPVNYIK